MSLEKPKPKSIDLYSLFLANIVSGVRRNLEEKRVEEASQKKPDTSSDKNKGS